MASSSLSNIVVDHPFERYNDNLELRLNQIGKIFDVPRIINEPRGKQQIINYYANGKFFDRFGQPAGKYFFHHGISYDGKHKKEDFEEQARIVERYIEDSDAKKVLELGCGLGANISFLARRSPCVFFDGVDLSLKPLKRFTKIPNAHFQLGDYHDLSALEDDAYDIIFIIEALCYSINKLQVLCEVKKKLKRNGLLIIIDVYQRDRGAPLSPSEETMLKLIEMSWSLDKFECIKDVESYMREDYSIVIAKDLTHYILPSATRVARYNRSYFSHPMYARAINKLLSLDVAKSFIESYLVPISLRRQIACYYIHVLKNDR
ncbi:MAG TPA: class I SAM-dependent methyltransferase [Candidatus Acidoferrales bacterium]|nr:class I SAM-dependent methyltransferase [Candidatus Acidoferrales bacterium]